jgi:hypothetical protein
MVRFRILHPLEMEGRRPIFEAMQVIHPGRLLRKRNLAEAHQCDAHTARD